MVSEIKPIAGMSRTRLSQIVPLSTPYTIYVFPTTYCNFKCVYCGHSLGHKKMAEEYGFEPQNMAFETFLKIMNQLKGFKEKLKVLSLTGHGEPLLHPDISKMVSIAKQENIAERIEIITNGSLLTRDLSERLIDSGLDCLRISIQGVTEQKYKEICQYEIKFEEIVQNIEHFYKHRGKCQLFIKIMDIALDDHEQELKFYKSFENISDRMFIEKCRPVYSGVKLTEGIDVTIDRYGRSHEHREVCPLCFYMLGIFPNGDVEPCDTIYKPVILGNVNKQPLLEMWNGNKLKEFRIMQLNMERNSHKKCSICCAPDDVSHPEDVLDQYSKEIKKRL